MRTEELSLWLRKAAGSFCIILAQLKHSVLLCSIASSSDFLLIPFACNSLSPPEKLLCVFYTCSGQFTLPNTRVCNMVSLTAQQKVTVKESYFCRPCILLFFLILQCWESDGNTAFLAKQDVGH